MREFLKRIGRALGLVAKPQEAAPCIVIHVSRPDSSPADLIRGSMREVMAREGEKIRAQLAEQFRVAAARVQRDEVRRGAAGGMVNIRVMGRIGERPACLFVAPLSTPVAELAAEAKLRQASIDLAAVILDALQNG